MSNIGPRLVTPDDEPDFEAVEIEIETLDEDDIEEMEEQSENLVNEFDEDKLMQIGREVCDDFDNDKQSRSDWARSYVQGLDLLGLKMEERTQPWEGASGVFHPILTETIIRFQAQAMGEMYPASGPARTKVVRKNSPEVLKQAQRVEREINYQITEKMEEYREETEQALFHLPLAGSAFKKVYYDPVEERPAAMFVPAEDMVVPYGATSLLSAERYTHVMKKTEEEIAELIAADFYADVDLPDPQFEPSDIQEKYDDIAGEEQTFGDDTRYTLLEMHCNKALYEDEGDDTVLPYVITVDKTSQRVLSIRRNYSEDDPKKRRRRHFVHYRYLPGLGFYGFGLINLLGGLSKTATSILRQLIDAGTLANLPAGLKTRGLRIKGDNTPFRPGEFRDVDVPGGTIDQNITFLPYKEPSSVLYQLLNTCVDEARRIGAVAETELTQMSKEMPVGTAFAILERQMKVMTGVQARLHAALKHELKLIAEIIYKDMGPEYDWTDEFNRNEDFDGRVDVIPVSDPNAATTAQKVVSYQAAMQMAQQAPNLYDMGKLHRQMLDVLEIDNANEILKLPDDIKPMDPVTENMAILKQEPVKAFKYQDHESHIRVHMAAMQDPKLQQLVGQSPFAEAIGASLSAHITEHVAFEYRRQVEKSLGVPLPDDEQPLPEDVEIEVSRMAAEAAEKLLGKHQQEVAAEQAQEEAQNPLTQIQMREIALDEQKFQHESKVDLMKLELEAHKHGVNIAHQIERLNSEELRAALQASVKLATEPSAQEKVALQAAKTVQEDVRILKEDARDQRNRGK